MEQFDFTLTQKAAEQIKLISRKEGKEPILKVSVVGGGCVGLQYKLSFVETVLQNHYKVHWYGLDIIIDKKSALFLKGTELDFTDGLDGQGFVYSNPNAKTKCGCGTSFGA
jgi:iron-sulfur cluster assembly protein